MRMRLRVLVAVAATAVLGVTGAVAAAVPASALTGGICLANNSACLEVGPAGSQYSVGTVIEDFVQNCSGNGQTTYNGEPYCEVNSPDTNLCLEWDKTGGGIVISADCNGNIVSQHWWWSGQRFRNLYATDENDPACLNAESNDYVDTDSCSISSSKWEW
jgi:hypothetical protein